MDNPEQTRTFVEAHITSHFSISAIVVSNENFWLLSQYLHSHELFHMAIAKAANPIPSNRSKTYSSIISS